MSSSPSALPTPRQLLTSILNQISEIPAPTATGAGNGPAKGSSSTINRTDSFPGQVREPPANPLRLIDARHRPLFTTLHVLFPSLLLPALELLDRGLVTRLVSPVGDDAAAAPAGAFRLAPQEDGGARETRREDDGSPQARDSTEAATRAASPSVYLVRSAQKPSRRPYGGGGDAAAATSAPATAATSSTSSQRTYVVHTSAWNCTCAAFAFSAFPPLAGAPTLLAPGRGEEEHLSATAIIMGDGEGDGVEGGGTGPCQFGGVSFDGCAGAGGVPPCCKHLLACVLAERWGRGLGRYVARREVGREEMAGVFADI